MKTVPKITQKHWNESERVLPVHASSSELCNKAIEIALAEQSAQQETYITAEEARKRPLQDVNWYHSEDGWITPTALHIFSDNRKYRLAWHVKHPAIQPQAQPEPVPFPLPAHDRAKLKAQQTKPEPAFKEVDLAGAIERMSEPVGQHAALRAEYAKQVEEGTTGFYLWEFQNDGYPRLDCVPCVPEFNAETQYFCTDISCHVSKDGEPAIRMLRTDAQKLQRQTKDTHDWFYDNGTEGIRGDVFGFDSKSGLPYTYAPKALKQVSWSALPVGVMTNNGIFHGVFDDRGMVKRQGEFPQYFLFKDLELAPAADQPWIAFQGNNIHEQINKLAMAGFALEVDVNRYRVLSLAEGYEMEKAE